MLPSPPRCTVHGLQDFTAVWRSVCDLSTVTVFCIAAKCCVSISLEIAGPTINESKKVHIKCYNYCIVNNKHILLHHKSFCGGKAVTMINYDD